MSKERIESKYVTVELGVEIHYIEKGEGNPMLLIPGLTFASEIFMGQLEGLTLFIT